MNAGRQNRPTAELRAIRPAGPWPLTPDKRAETYPKANWGRWSRSARRANGHRGPIFSRNDKSPHTPYSRMSAAGRHVLPAHVLASRAAKLELAQRRFDEAQAEVAA